MLLKQQENFEKTLTAQDEKLHSLSDMANSLVKAGHRDRQWYDPNATEIKIFILPKSYRTCLFVNFESLVIHQGIFLSLMNFFFLLTNLLDNLWVS